MLTSNQNISSSECPLHAECLRKKKELDDDYACRQALCALVYDAYNDDDNYGYKHFKLYTDSISKCHACPQVSQTNCKESFCPQHKNLYGLWLLDSGATDHSMPYMDEFLTFKELQKPVKVCTTGKECIFFTGIGTVVFTMTVNSKSKEICLQQVYYSPSGDKHICSVQWLTMKLHMQTESNVKTTHIFDSQNQPFLVGQLLLPRNNLHWFIGKPHTRVQALGFSMNLNISLDTVKLATVRDEVTNYDLWHLHLGHPAPQTMWHVSHATDGLDSLQVPMTLPICSDCQIGKMPTQSFPPSDKCKNKLLSMVHCDLVKFPIKSYYQHKYCLTIINDYSGYGTICLLQLNLDTAMEFQTWVTWAEKQMGHSLL